MGDFSLREVSTEGKGLTTTLPVNLMAQRNFALTEEEARMLNKWIGLEIKSVHDEVVQLYKDKLKGSSEPEDKELLTKLNESPAPLDLVIERISRQKAEEKKLDAEIKELTNVRDGKLKTYNDDLAQVCFLHLTSNSAHVIPIDHIHSKKMYYVLSPNCVTISILF